MSTVNLYTTAPGTGGRHRGSANRRFVWGCSESHEALREPLQLVQGESLPMLLLLHGTDHELLDALYFLERLPDTLV